LCTLIAPQIFAEFKFLSSDINLAKIDMV